MNTQQKTALLSQRQQEAIQTATTAEKAARREFLSRLIILNFGLFELCLPLLGARKRRQRYEQAQEKRLAIVANYARIIAAVPVDYTETNQFRTA